METEEKITDQKEATAAAESGNHESPVATAEKSEENSSSCGELLVEIHEGQVKMRPKWQFIIEQGLFAASFLIIASIIFYLSSFIVFSLHQSGVIYLPQYGSSGWLAFFAFLPWPLIILAFLLVVMLELMVQQFAFAYHNPIALTFGALLIIVIAVSCLISGWHRPIYRLAKENRFPVAGAIYRHFSDRDLDGVRRGEVRNVSGTTFIIEDDSGATTSVVITPDSRGTVTEVREGNFIFIFGREDQAMHQIQAFGMHQLVR